MRSVELRSGETIHFRRPTENDGSEMYRIVQQSEVLDVNSPYSYLMWSKYFNKTSIVAVCENQIIGFVTGFIQPEDPNTLFIWQIAVDKHYRGHGLATKLIEQLLVRLREEEIIFLEATVTPSNIPSSKLFKGIAEKQKTNCAIFECFSKELFPDENHETEFTYRIGPLQINN